MLRKDIICRAAIHPRFLNLDVFDDAQFFSFVSIDQTKTVYVSSVFSRFLSRTDEQVHTYGEAAAAAGNERLKERFDGIIPDDKENYYLGFYKLQCGPVLEVKMEFYDIHIKWRPENDCDAHFQIEMWQNGADSSRRQRTNDRTVATEMLAVCLSGPKIPDFEGDRFRSALAADLPKKEWNGRSAAQEDEAAPVAMA